MRAQSPARGWLERRVWGADAFETLLSRAGWRGYPSSLLLLLFFGRTCTRQRTTIWLSVNKQRSYWLYSVLLNAAYQWECCRKTVTLCLILRRLFTSIAYNLRCCQCIYIYIAVTPRCDVTLQFFPSKDTTPRLPNAQTCIERMEECAHTILYIMYHTAIRRRTIRATIRSTSGTVTSLISGYIDSRHGLTSWLCR